MKKLFLVLIALLVVLTFASGAYSADGDELSTTTFRIDGNGEMWFQELNELVSTNDTVTAAESGKVFFMTHGYDHINMTLPAVDEGLTYTFISQTTNKFDIRPNGTDIFAYSTAAAGNSLRSAGAAGETITVHASDDTTWFVDTHGATFTIVQTQ